MIELLLTALITLCIIVVISERKANKKHKNRIREIRKRKNLHYDK